MLFGFSIGISTSVLINVNLLVIRNGCVVWTLLYKEIVGRCLMF